MPARPRRQTNVDIRNTDKWYPDQKVTVKLLDSKGNDLDGGTRTVSCGRLEGIWRW